VRIKKTKGHWTLPEEPRNIQSHEVRDPGASYGMPLAGPFRLLKVVRHPEDFPNEKAMYLSVIRGGLPRRSLDALLETTGLSIYEMAQILDTSDRTLRRHDDETLLSREHSERLLEMAQLYSRGEEVFGSLEVFRQWMQSDVPALGGAKPKSFLDTSLGINLLINELGRIEQGVFA
jgi:putative toxin-antitoxin system antitoxin component (TIGR02293 family)